MQLLNGFEKVIFFSIDSSATDQKLTTNISSLEQDFDRMKSTIQGQSL